MCIGIPMKVVKSGIGTALCEGMGEERTIDTLLTGDVPEDTWLLVFHSSAREILTEENALKLSQALEALQTASKSSNSEQSTADYDQYFSDLITQERKKPETHIRLSDDDGSEK